MRSIIYCFRGVCAAASTILVVAIAKFGSYDKNRDSGIPQGSVLGPILFVLYINDLPSNILSEVYMFADDTKIFNIIKSPEDQEILQDDLDTLSMWSDKWLLKCHPEKCKVMHLGKAGDTEYFY